MVFFTLFIYRCFKYIVQVRTRWVFIYFAQLMRKTRHRCARTLPPLLTWNNINHFLLSIERNLIFPMPLHFAVFSPSPIFAVIKLWLPRPLLAVSTNRCQSIIMLQLWSSNYPHWAQRYVLSFTSLSSIYCPCQPNSPIHLATLISSC